MRRLRVMLICLAITACESPEGPMGPSGQAGANGAQGPQGMPGLQGPAGAASTSLFVARFDDESDVFAWGKTRDSWEITDGRLLVSGSGSEDQGTHLAPSTSFDGDIEISVDTEWLEGTTDWSYGLSIRAGAEGRYQFGISATGGYIVGILGGTIAKEALVDWTISENINVRGRNNLRVTAYGDQFRFYVNDQLMAEFSDSRLASGRVSVFVEKLQEVAFDNLTVRKIEAGPLR
jgi:hypothetical protein